MEAWEEAWVHSHGVSPARRPGDIIRACRQYVREAKPLPLSLKGGGSGSAIGNWTPAEVSTEWKWVAWPVSPDDLKNLRGVRFTYTSGRHALEIEQVELVGDGRMIDGRRHCRTGRKTVPGELLPTLPPEGVHANNGLLIRAKVRTVGGNDSRGKIELLKKNG